MRRYLLLISIFCVYASYAEVLFDAEFDSGSIGEVVRIDSTDHLHYIVNTRIDPVNPYHPDRYRSQRWFYFRMVGVKDKTVSLEIKVNDSRRAMYSYDNVDFERFSKEESPEYNGTITKRYDRDTVYIAYYQPYTLERSESMIAQWRENGSVTPFSIGESIEGRKQQALLITNNAHSGLIPDEDGKLRPTDSDREKRVIYIHGRIHPSETPASWTLESAVNRIISLGETLDSVIFYIIPFTNPDGVVGGYSRTNVDGADLEGCYDFKELSPAPEVANIKRFVEAIKSSGLDMAIALNFHAQSSAKCSYWIHSAKSTSKSYNRDQKMLSMLSTQQNPYFEWRNMDHSHLKSRYVEGWIYRLFRGEATAITFETPYSFYRWRPNLAGWVTPTSLEVIGERVVDAIVDKLAISTSDCIYLSEPKRAAGFAKIKNNNYLYFGSSALRSQNIGEKITYSESLPAGRYEVYKWEVGRDYRNQWLGRNCWRYHSVIDHKGGELILTTQCAGEIFDMIKLKKLKYL
ncbi:MAG: M14-type cytosolic carboxypeptidase [Rikenellaceae bacterium]